MRRPEFGQLGMPGLMRRKTRHMIKVRGNKKNSPQLNEPYARIERVSDCGKFGGWKGLLTLFPIDEQGQGLKPIGGRQRSSEVFLGSQA
jgi:hypothetical protein